jgi:hypothetical protein
MNKMNGKDLAIHTVLGTLTTIAIKKPLKKQMDKMNLSDDQKSTYTLTGQGTVMGAFMGDYFGLEKNQGSKNYTLKERGLSIFLGAVAGGLSAYVISNYITPNGKNQAAAATGTADDDPAQASTEDNDQ